MGKTMDMENRAVTFFERGGNLVASLSCEIDHHTAKHVRERIDRELFLRKPQVLILDFGGVRFMDSSGIALILGRVETAESLNCHVRLQGLTPTLMKLVKLSGLEKIKNLTVCTGI